VSSEAQVDLLTREELDAILSDPSLDPSDARSRSRLAQPFRRDRVRSRPPAPKAPQLRDAVEMVGAAWAKDLASRHQRRVSCSLIEWDEVDVSSFVDTMIPTDRMTTFAVEPSGTRGFVVLARPLVFALLTLSFGGRRPADGVVPSRAYTRIEQRLIRSVAVDLLQRLEPDCRSGFEVALHPGDVCGPAEIGGEDAGTLLLATLELSGLSPIGRLRIALPVGPFQAPTTRTEAPVTEGAPAIRGSLAGVPVKLCAEIGSVELTLAQIGALEPGDVLTLRPSAADGLLVRVEGSPKFLASRGSLGSRLAVRISERIGRTGDGA